MRSAPAQPHCNGSSASAATKSHGLRCAAPAFLGGDELRNNHGRMGTSATTGRLISANAADRRSAANPTGAALERGTVSSLFMSLPCHRRTSDGACAVHAIDRASLVIDRHENFAVELFCTMGALGVPSPRGKIPSGSIPGTNMLPNLILHGISFWWQTDPRSWSPATCLLAERYCR
jgi:hypothetical protein